MSYKPNELTNTGEIAIYQTRDKRVRLEVKLEKETVWLSQIQMASLFGKAVPTINEHIKNTYKEGELKEGATIRKLRIVQTEGGRAVTRNIDLYNLDVIISVGYRVKSLRGTQFRIWATSVLKKHLIDGYTIYERRLREQTQKLGSLQKAIKLISDVRSRKELDYKEAMGLLAVISDYNYALGLLDDYDNKKLSISRTSKEEKFELTYEEASKAVAQLKKKFGGSELFGKEKEGSFKSSIAAIYQTFDGKNLYPSIEEKAANLLYFIVKNHSFVDGNKRIAASIFLWFLEENGLLYKADGTKRIADNALVALTLMIAESNPKERDIILILVVNLINKNN